MRILIDTHVLLWLITDDARLSDHTKRVFLNKQNSLFFSLASCWEMCIKVSIGKLKLSDDWFQRLEQELALNTIQWLPIAPSHCLQVSKLPPHHHDPFDRLLVAQAMMEDLVLMTNDQHMANYGVRCV